MNMKRHTRSFLSLCAGLAALCGAAYGAMPSAQAAQITVTEFPDNTVSDEVIKITRGAVIQDIKGTKDATIQFEVVKLDVIGFEHLAGWRRFQYLDKDHSIRKLARESKGGFSQSWEPVLNLRMRTGKAMGRNSETKTGTYYIVIDRDGDKIGETIYKLLLDPKKPERSKIVGVAVSSDGSAITPMEAKKAGL